MHCIFGCYFVLLTNGCLFFSHTQYTEDGHEDKENLQKAITTMTEVATAINEFKRRKDLGKVQDPILASINVLKLDAA